MDHLVGYFESMFMHIDHVVDRLERLEAKIDMIESNQPYNYFDSDDDQVYYEHHDEDNEEGEENAPILVENLPPRTPEEMGWRSHEETIKSVDTSKLREQLRMMGVDIQS